MNRSKQNISENVRKKMRKELRTPPKEKQTISIVLRPSPKKARKDAEVVNGALRRVQIKKTKALGKKTSKRTTPKEVSQRTMRGYSHAEGEVWLNTLQKQNRLQAKSLTHQMDKKRIAYKRTRTASERPTQRQQSRLRKAG